MINKTEFAKMLSNEYQMILQQVADLTQADSLLQPQLGGNCMNWVLGHYADSLINLLTVLGGTLPEDLPSLECYRRESEPILEEAEGVLRLNVLVQSCDKLTTAITTRLDLLSEQDFDAEINLWGSKARRGWWAFFFFFHNTYHLGQLEYLRNLAGKTEKVI